jgi:hypothetical protein
LYEAVMQRFAVPVVTEQLRRLRAVLAQPKFLLHDVLLCFYEPPINLVHKLGAKGEVLSLFLGRAQTEPEPVYSLIDRHYAGCRNEFIRAFKQVIPGLSEADYQWRFEFMLSLIVAFLTRQKMIRARYSQAKSWKPREVLDRLTAFCEQGMGST